MPLFGGFSSSSRHHSHRSERDRSPERSHSHSYRPAYARSASGWSTRSSSSYYKRRPRDGYIAYLVHHLRRLLRDLWSFARRHPMKIFVMVIMPLVSGGALATVARQFGVRLPDMLNGRGAGGGSRRYAGGYYGSQGYGESEFGGRSGGEGGGLGNLMQIAKAFM